MKYLFLLLFCNTVFAASAGIDVKITNQQAQKLYQVLSVTGDGAAGHVYKMGKDVVCIRTNAPVDDANGKPIPQEDPRRYVCKIHFDAKGNASSPKVY